MRAMSSDTAPLDQAGQQLLRLAVKRYGLSARAIHRVQKVARTIADLAEERHITSAHVAEALGISRRFGRSIGMNGCRSKGVHPW